MSNLKEIQWGEEDISCSSVCPEGIHWDLYVKDGCSQVRLYDQDAYNDGVPIEECLVGVVRFPTIKQGEEYYLKGVGA